MWKYLLPVLLLIGPASAQQTNIGGGTASVSGVTNVTVTDCSSAIQTAGVAQQAFGADLNHHGFIVANIDPVEPLWISFTGAAAIGGSGSYPLAPAMSTTTATLSGPSIFIGPTGMGISTALSVVAATYRHKFTCSVW